MTATRPHPSRLRRRPPAPERSATTASTKKSTGSPSRRPVNCVHTHAWYTSPAAMASRQAQHTARGAPPGRPRPTRRRRRGGTRGSASASATHVGKCCTRKAFVPPDAVAVASEHVVRPAARSLRDPRPQPVSPGVGIGQVAEPAAADGPVGAASRHHVEHLARCGGGCRQRRRDDRARSEPVTGQGGGRWEAEPRRRRGERAQHRRGARPGRRAARCAPAQLVRRCGVISRRRSSAPASFSGLRIA